MRHGDPTRRRALRTVVPEAPEDPFRLERATRDLRLPAVAVDTGPPRMKLPLAGIPVNGEHSDRRVDLLPFRRGGARSKQGATRSRPSWVGDEEGRRRSLAWRGFGRAATMRRKVRGGGRRSTSGCARGGSGLEGRGTSFPQESCEHQVPGVAPLALRSDLPGRAKFRSDVHPRDHALHVTARRLSHSRCNAPRPSEKHRPTSAQPSPLDPLEDEPEKSRGAKASGLAEALGNCGRLTTKKVSAAPSSAPSSVLGKPSRNSGRKPVPSRPA